MPRCLDPNHRFPIILDSDASKPPESRPTFYFRSFSARRWREIRESPASILDVLRDALVGWENLQNPAGGMPIDFAANELENCVDPGQLQELLDKLVEASTLSPSDKKKLESQRSISTENSAQAAVPANA